MSHENIMRLWNAAATGGSIHPQLNVIVKTASYTVTAGDMGSVFTTRGAAGAVKFTLPSAGSANSGGWALFVNVADQNMFVGGTDEGLVVLNDLTADSIGFATAGEKIGGALLAVSDGTSWVVSPMATEAQTVNIGTAASATPSSSPSSTPSSSISATPTSSPSSSISATPTSSPSSSISATPTSSPSSSTSSSPSASASSSPSSSSSATPTSSPSSSPSSSTSSSPSASASSSPSSSVSATPTSTQSSSPSVTPSSSPSST
jgi:hypothetical protein